MSDRRCQSLPCKLDHAIGINRRSEKFEKGHSPL
jgi:hypothetical protein